MLGISRRNLMELKKGSLHNSSNPLKIKEAYYNPDLSI